MTFSEKLSYLLDLSGASNAELARVAINAFVMAYTMLEKRVA